MYTGRYPTGLCLGHDGVGEGPPRPAPRQGRARAHPQRVTTTVPRSRHQPDRHGPTLRGGPGVEAHGLPTLQRQGRTRRRIPAPIRSRRHAGSVRPHRPHAPRTTPRGLRTTHDRDTGRHHAPVPLHRGVRRNPRPSTTPHANAHTTTRKPSPHGSPKPHAKPAPPTPNSSANNWRCSSMAPRPATEPSTPKPSPPPPPSPPSSSTTPSPHQPSDEGVSESGHRLVAVP